PLGDTEPTADTARNLPEFGVRVSVDALSELPVAPTGAAGVLKDREHPQVVRIDASTVLALVIDGHAHRYLSAGPVDPCGTVSGRGATVRHLRSLLPPDLRVAVRPGGVGADPAPGLRLLVVGGSGTLCDAVGDDERRPGSPVTVFWSGFALERVAGSLHG